MMGIVQTMTQEQQHNSVGQGSDLTICICSTNSDAEMSASRCCKHCSLLPYVSFGSNDRFECAPKYSAFSRFLN
jgi:hypothetical protein